MGVQVNGNGQVLFQLGYECFSCQRLEQACHVFDGQQMGTFILKAAGQVEVVLKVVLGAGRVADVAGVANAGLSQGAGFFAHRPDAHLHGVEPVERIEDPEQVDSLFCGIYNKLLNQIVGVCLVANGIAAPEQHLEEGVGDFFAKNAQPLPGAFAEKAHGHIKGGTSPHFDGKYFRMVLGVAFGDVVHVEGPHSGGEQRLVCIAEGGVGVMDRLFSHQPFAEIFPAQFLQAVSAAGRVGEVFVEEGYFGIAEMAVGIDKFHVRVSIHDHVAEVAQGLGGAVEAHAHVHELGVRLQEAHGCISRLKLGVVDHIAEKIDVRFHPPHPEFPQGPVDPLGSTFERTPPAGQFHEHGVEEGRNLHARINAAAIQADSKAARAAVRNDLAVVGLEIFSGIFGCNAALNSEACDLDRILAINADFGISEEAARGNQDLRFDNINARDFLRHGVLHLYPGVDLDEINPVVLVHEEFNGPGIVVAYMPGNPEGIVVEFFANGIGQGGRGHFHHFLKAALNGTIAFVEVNDVAVVIAEDLDFEVLGTFNEFFEEYRVVAKGFFGLVSRLEKCFRQLFFVPDNAHSSSAATCSSLEHDGIADGFGLVHSILEGEEVDLGIRNEGNIDLPGHFFRPNLVAQLLHHPRPRPDEGDTGFLTGPDKIDVFRQKTIARVNSLHPFPFRQPDDPFNVEIRFERLVFGADHVGFVSFVAVKRIAVFVGIHGHCPHFKLGKGTKDTNGDFSPVGNEDFLEGLNGFGHGG